MKIICFCWLNVADLRKYSQHPICQNHVKENVSIAVLIKENDSGPPSLHSTVLQDTDKSVET